MKDSKGNEIFDYEVDGDIEEAFILSAVYQDGSEVADDELNYLTDTYQDVLTENRMERSRGSSEAYWEGDR